MNGTEPAEETEDVAVCCGYTDCTAVIGSLSVYVAGPVGIV